jgi:hypothetical protein
LQTAPSSWAELDDLESSRLKLESRVSDQALYISNVNKSGIDPTKPIEFVVKIKSLENLNSKGAGSIEVTGIQGEELSVSL